MPENQLGSMFWVRLLLKHRPANTTRREAVSISTISFSGFESSSSPVFSSDFIRSEYPPDIRGKRKGPFPVSSSARILRVCHVPRPISARSSRRYGRILRNLLTESFMSYQLHEVTPESFTVNVATVPETVPQMGNPVHHDDPHVHFRPADSPPPFLPIVTEFEPEGIFTLEEQDEASTSDSETTTDSDDGFGDYINDEYRLAFLETFSRTHHSIREAIGTQRVLQCFNDLTHNVRRITAIASTPKTSEIVALLDTFPPEDSTRYCSYEQALVWTKILLNHTTNLLIIEEHDEYHSNWSYAVNMRSCVYEQLTLLTFNSSLRAFEVFDPSFATAIRLMEFRSGMNAIIKRSIICYRLIMMSGNREIFKPEEHMFVRRMTWFRQQSCFMALGAIRTGNITPIPDLPDDDVSYNSYGQFHTQGIDDIQVMMSYSDLPCEEQGFYDYFVGSLKEGAAKVAGTAAAGAVQGVTDEFLKNPAVAFGMKMAGAVGSAAKVGLGFLMHLWELLPAFTPLLALFAAWRFSETASVTWALIAVGLAVAGGFHAAKWFENVLFPIIVRRVRSVFQHKTNTVSTSTVLTGEELDAEFIDDPNPFSLLSFLYANREQTRKGKEKEEPELVRVEDDDLLWYTRGDSVLTARSRDIQPEEHSGEPNTNPLMSAELLASLASTALLTSGIFLKDSNGLISIFSKYTGVVTGMKGIISVFVAIAAFVINRGSTNIAYSSLPLGGKEVQVASYLDEVERIFALNVRGQIPKTQSYVDRLTTVIEDGQRVLVHAAGSPLNAILIGKLRELGKIREGLVAAVGRTGLTRMEPVCIGLFGKPGTYKSLTLLALGKALVRLLLEREGKQEAIEVFNFDQGAYIFTKPAGEHWDGINDLTLGFIDDDFGQTLPGINPGSQGADFVHLNNGVRYNPKMAGLHLKNTAQIRHKFTLVSSNMNKFQDKTMLEPDAVTRRLEMNFEPEIEDRSVMGTMFDPEKMLYQPIGFDGNNVLKPLRMKKVTFFEMVIMIYNEIIRKEEFFNSSERLLDGIIDDIVTKAPKADPMVEARAEMKRLADQLRIQKQSGKAKTVPQCGEECSDPIRHRFRFLMKLAGMGLSEEESNETLMRFFEDFPEYGEIYHFSEPGSIRDDWAMITSKSFSEMYLPKAKPIEVAKTEGLGTLLKGWYSTAGESFNRAKQYVAEHGSSLFTGNTLAGLLSGLAMATGLYAWWTTFMSGSEQVYQKETRTAREKINAAKAARLRAQGKRVPAVPQASDNVIDAIHLAEKNKFNMRIVRKGNGRLVTVDLGRALGVLDTVFVAPWHFWVQIVASEVNNPDMETTIQFHREGFDQSVTIDDFEILNEQEFSHDRVAFRITRVGFPAVRKIIQHFAWDKEIFNAMSSYSAGLTGIIVRDDVHVERRLRRTPILTLETDDPEDDGKRLELITYMYKNERGDCGFPVVLSSGPGTGKIAGIHTHGNGTVGHATTISRDWLTKCLGKAEVPEAYAAREVYAELLEDPPAPQGKLDFHPPGCDIVATGVEPASMVFQKNDNIPWHPNGESKLPKQHTYGASDIHPKRFTPNRATFQPKVLNHPTWNAYLPHLAKSIVDKIRAAAPFEGVLPKLTFEQAIDGDLDLELDALSTSKSTGYPLSSRGFDRTKFWTRSQTGQTIPGPLYRDLMEEVAHLEWCAKQGKIPCIWQIFQKAEKLKLKKIVDGKTRDVNCAPLAYLILSRMYLGAGLSVILRGSPQNEFLLTTDPCSADQWDSFTREMMLPSEGKYCEAGDFKGFDHSHSEAMLNLPDEVFRLLYAGCSPTESRVRSAIIDCVKRPELIFGSTIERRTGCMPSGFLGTTPFNCIINAGLFRFAWLALHDFSLEVLPMFDEHVVAKFCGDDNIFSVSALYKDSYTPAHLARVFGELNYVYTSADKTEPKSHNSHLTEHTMVKRGFRFEPLIGKWVGPLELDRVIETCMWSKSGRQTNIIGADNCETTIRELSLHGKQVFDEWFPKIRDHAAGFWTPSSSDWEVVFLTTTKQSHRYSV